LFNKGIVEEIVFHCANCSKIINHPRCGKFCNMGCFYGHINSNIEMFEHWLKKEIGT